MNSQHFYVENSRLMSYGLSNIGTQNTTIFIKGDESISALAGKLIGAGLHSLRDKYTEQLITYTRHKNPFVRKAAFIGLSFSNMLSISENITESIIYGFNDKDIEVRKTALIGFGIANSRTQNESLFKLLEKYLNDEEWKIRSAAGLAYSYLAAGNPNHFEKFINILRNEDSPYVKVCSCWYISNSFSGTNKGFDEFSNLLKLKSNDDSYFRDMACLGLGLSYLGSSSKEINEILKHIIINDPHPYVRESAYFGLALCNFKRPTSDIIKVLNEGFNDKSMIVRSGAALSHGIICMDTKSIYCNSDNFTDSSILWGLSISEGLAGAVCKFKKNEDDYIEWGYHIGNGFRNSIEIDLSSTQTDIKSFQQGIIDGLIGSNISEYSRKRAIGLMFPGVFHYLIFDSFWWGLWVLNALGNTINSIK